MSTLKGEILPFVVKKQLSRFYKNIKSNEKQITADEKPDIFNISKSENENNIRLMSCFGNVSTTEEMIKCYACVMNSNIGVRANTLYDYCKINKIVSLVNVILMKTKKYIIIFVFRLTN